MSRIGKMPVQIPQGVKVNIAGSKITVEGPKGKLEQDLLPEIEFDIKDDSITVTRKNESKRVRALHGLYRSLINNMITGVSSGFTKELQINGVGYRAEIKGKTLVLNLGYSNPIEYPIQDGIDIKVEANTRLIVSSINKQQLGHVCSIIRGFRPPEPYKGKGVKYKEEIIRRKIGKSGIK
jgi:large subunit ribosomal protein L6